MKTKTKSNTGVSMFKTVDDLKEFLIWAKTQGIQSIKAKGVEVHYSALSLIPAETLKELTDGSATLGDLEPDNKKEDEELTYWSSNR